MNPEQRYCPNQYCSAGMWLVLQSRDNNELWHLADRPEGFSYAVAAVDPVCPHCGTTLCLTAEYAQPGDLLEAWPHIEHHV